MLRNLLQRDILQMINTAILLATVLGFGLFIYGIGEAVEENGRAIAANSDAIQANSDAIQALAVSTDARFEKIDARFEKADARFERIETSLITLAASSEARAKEQNEGIRRITELLARMNEEIKNNALSLQTHIQAHGISPKDE